MTPDWTDEARALLGKLVGHRSWSNKETDADTAKAAAALRAAYERGFTAGHNRATSRVDEYADTAWRRHSGEEPEPKESSLTMEDIRARYE